MTALLPETRYLSDHLVNGQFEDFAATGAATTGSPASFTYRLGTADLAPYIARQRADEFVSRAIERLELMRPNWDGDNGRAISPRALAYAAGLVPDLAAQGVMIPSLVPVSDGGISIEWHRGGRQS